MAQTDLVFSYADSDRFQGCFKQSRNSHSLYLLSTRSQTTCKHKNTALVIGQFQTTAYLPDAGARITPGVYQQDSQASFTLPDQAMAWDHLIHHTWYLHGTVSLLDLQLSTVTIGDQSLLGLIYATTELDQHVSQHQWKHPEWLHFRTITANLSTLSTLPTDSYGSAFTTAYLSGHATQ